ncbi:MAG: hypothetical protein N2486_06190 [Caloramator sp.]|nr:hypothetical protein [Caloramator sp.]
MSEVNNTNDFEKRISKEINDLHAKYDMLSKEVEKLNKNDEALKESISHINSNFEKLNNNLEAILSKIETIPHINVEEIKQPKEKVSVGRRVGRSLRRLVVGTVGVILDVKDKTTEGIANIREGFEDIIAEAQYNNRKKRMVAAEE